MKRKSYSTNEWEVRIFNESEKLEKLFFLENWVDVMEKFDESKMKIHGFSRLRRFSVIERWVDDFIRKIRIRNLRTFFLIPRLNQFLITNTIMLSLYRKYILNKSFFKLISASPLRFDNLSLNKAAFCDVMESKKCKYLWYGAFAKKKFFFKKYIAKQPVLSLKRGSDLFFFGDFDFSNDELSLGFIVLKNYELFDNSFFENDNINSIFSIPFDMSLQQILEFYKLIQAIYLNNFIKFNLIY